jgi:hypothetical protein
LSVVFLAGFYFACLSVDRWGADEADDRSLLFLCELAKSIHQVNDDAAKRIMMSKNLPWALEFLTNALLNVILQ